MTTIDPWWELCRLIEGDRAVWIVDDDGRIVALTDALELPADRVIYFDAVRAARAAACVRARKAAAS